jgi:hypothetical protein
MAILNDEKFEPSSVTPMEKEIRNQEIPVPSAGTPLSTRFFLGLTNIAFHQKMCIPSKNLDQSVTEDEGRRRSLTF